MTSPADTLRQRLVAAFAPIEIDIEDESAQHAGHAGARSGGHYRLRIVAAAFSGQPLLTRHRMIYEALGPLQAIGVHALAIQALAPEQVL